MQNVFILGGPGVSSISHVTSAFHMKGIQYKYGTYMDSSACFLDSTACCSLSCSATWACRSISLKLWLLTFWAPRPFLAPNFKQTNKKKKTHKSQSPCVIPVYRHSTACNKTRKNTQELTLQQQVLRDQPQHTPDRNKVYFFLLI